MGRGIEGERERERRISRTNTCLHFSICACHPCAAAMQISVASVQFDRMIPKGNPLQTSKRTRKTKQCKRTHINIVIVYIRRSDIRCIRRGMAASKHAFQLSSRSLATSQPRSSSLAASHAHRRGGNGKCMHHCDGSPGVLIGPKPP